MYVQRILLYCLGLAAVQAATTNTGGSPYALIDEATALLTTLRAVIERAINSAHSRIEGYYDRFVTYINDVRTEAEVIIGYETQRIDGQVAAIVELAESAGFDVSSCLGNYREDIANFTTFLMDDMDLCMSDQITEADEIIVEHRYLVDIRINRVGALEFELGLCNPTSDECIEPIYERIKLERQYGVDVVDIVALQAINLLNQLRVLVQACSNLNVSQFVNNVNAILQEISECADDMIS